MMGLHLALIDQGPVPRDPDLVWAKNYYKSHLIRHTSSIRLRALPAITVPALVSGLRVQSAYAT